jgi:predicted permease
MKPEPAWRRYLRFWGPDEGSDIDEEFRFHLQAKIDDLVAAGMPPEEARREAERQFGPVRAVRRECHAIAKGRQERASRAEYFAGWFRDLKYAIRVLLRSKASSATAVLILAVGIGASTAVFTFLDRLLFAPLPVSKPAELVNVSTSAPGKDGKRSTGAYIPFAAYTHLRDHNQTFSGMAAVAALVARERRDIERPAEGDPVSGNFFQVLGVRALLGRVLAPGDDAPSAASHVAVASYRFWDRRFNRAPDALGGAVFLNKVPFTIVGILPRGFHGVDKAGDPDLYVPLGSLPELFDFNALAQGDWMRVLGRLKRGVSMETAHGNLQVLWSQFLASRNKSMLQESSFARLDCADGSAGRAGAGGEKKRSLLLVGGIVVLLLLMGCLNVACLLVARGAARRHEIAIRFSLGASKARILRQALMESCLLALAGGAVGLALAFWAERLLLIAFHWKDMPIDLAPDWRVLAFSLGVSLVTGILFGLAPAMQLLRGGRVALNQDRTVAPRFGAGKALVVVEVALSLVMVAGAAVFIRSFQNLRSAPVGFSPEHVSVVTLSARNSNDLYPPAAKALSLAESMRGAPRIEAIGAANLLTFNDGRIGYVVSLPEAPKPLYPTNILCVDGDYFNALHIPLAAGRTFTRLDDERAPKVVILAEGLARRLFGSQSPLGRRVLLGNRMDVEVVGIAKDIKFTIVTAPAPDVLFQPLLQAQGSGGAYSSKIHLQIRSQMQPLDVAAMVRARIRDQRLPLKVDSATALEDAIGASMLNDRIRMQASSLFGILALALITAGIYGLMAYSVARRTREIGIRMAVGSKPWQIVKLVLKESMALVLIGVAIGLPGAVAVMNAVSTMLFGLEPVDIASLACAAAALAVTAAAASVAPAWRAAHLNPMRALRVQ